MRPHRFPRRFPFCALWGAFVLATPSFAARPLATDDAVAAESGRCQVEAWWERAQGNGATVLAPACGLVEGVELGLQLVLPRAQDAVRNEAGLGLKLAPPAWRLQTALGDWAFGLKADAVFQQHHTSRVWHHTTSGLQALASLAPAPGWALHVNFGAVHDRPSGRHAGSGKAAIVWTPVPPWLCFAEWQANTRADIFGGTVRAFGARWWLEPEVLGLDFSAGRERGVGTTLWTFGLGWYGWSL